MSNSAAPLRIPVSLKVEQDDQDFKRFVEELRDSKRLSSFLMDLLSAYYYDASIKGAVDDYMTSNTPFAKVITRIQHIQQEHSRSIMDLEMTSQQVGIASRKAEQVGQALSESRSEVDPVLEGFKRGVDSRFELLEGNVTGLSQKLDQLLTLMTANPNPNAPVIRDGQVLIPIPTQEHTPAHREQALHTRPPQADIAPPPPPQVVVQASTQAPVSEPEQSAPQSAPAVVFEGESSSPSGGFPPFGVQPNPTEGGASTPSFLQFAEEPSQPELSETEQKAPSSLLKLRRSKVQVTIPASE